MLRTICILSLLAVSACSAETVCTHEGKNYQDGETWVIQNAFVVKCVTENNGSWKTEISGCATPTGTKIEAGNSIEEGEKVFECLKNDLGQVVLKESKGAKADCGSHKFEEEWVERSFKFRCEKGGISKFIACVTNDGTVINEGETGKARGIDVKCVKHDNGTITMASAKEPTEYQCDTKDGFKKNYGEEWNDGNFVRKCTEYGVAKIQGCRAEGIANTIPVGNNATVGDLIYSCGKDGDKFTFKTFTKKAEVTQVEFCEHEGKLYENGSNWISQNAFRLKCVIHQNATYKTDILSCITPAGLEIPIGTKIEEGNSVFECTSPDASSGAGISLKSTPGQNGKCRQTYSVGEEWIEDSFKFQCQPYGRVDIKSCISREGVEIPVGQTRRVPAGYAMECVHDNEGNIVLRTAKNADCETSDGLIKKAGETWNEGTFVRKCADFGISTIHACIVDGVGTVGMNRNLTHGNQVYICENNGNQFSFRAVPVRTTNN